MRRFIIRYKRDSAGSVLRYFTKCNAIGKTYSTTDRWDAAVIPQNSLIPVLRTIYSSEYIDSKSIRIREIHDYEEKE